MFGSKRRRAEVDMRIGQMIEDRYTKALASWQVEHDTNRKDMTEEQDRRAREYAVLLNAGLDASHLTFIRLRYRSGALHDNKR
jgi:hypothetical protein